MQNTTYQPDSQDPYDWAQDLPEDAELTASRKEAQREDAAESAAEKRAEEIQIEMLA